MNEYSFPPSRRASEADPSNDRSVGYRYSRVVATATALPERRVTNEEIIATYGHRVTAAAIRRIVGVSERRVAERGIADTDLLAMATRQCLEKAGLQPRELSKLIVTKFLGDRLLPMTASFLQHKVGCDAAIQAYDIDGGTHSFCQAIDAAACCIACGDGPILVASGGVVNCLISRTDPRVAFSYGDGAAAVLLAPASEPHILSTYGFSNHEFVDAVTAFSVLDDVVAEGHQGWRCETLSRLYRQRDWKPTRVFVLDAMRTTVHALLLDSGMRKEDIDLYLVTENHYRLWLAILEALGVAPSETVSLLPDLGNTMSAMLPMALDEALRSRRVGAGSLVMLLSLGEGLAGGGMLIRL